MWKRRLIHFGRKNEWMIVVNDYSFTFNGSILSYFLLADTLERMDTKIMSLQNSLLIIHFGCLTHHINILIDGPSPLQLLARNLWCKKHKM